MSLNRIQGSSPHKKKIAKLSVPEPGPGRWRQDTEYEGVADQQHDGMNDGPEESANRADVAVLEVANNQILQ